MIHQTPATTREKLLTLSDGRTLAYEHTGVLDSLTVIIFFSGTLSVGTASPDRFPEVLASQDAHYIAPTLPGYGNTFPPCTGISYAATIISDTSALLDHFYPDTAQIDLYISGGSFGTVPAQMLYGAASDIFPHARNIRKMLLLGAFPPLGNCNDRNFDYARYMTWQNYFGVGPPSKYIPFRILPRLLKRVMQSKMKSQEKAEAFIRQILFDKMDAEEKGLYKKWREEKGYEEGQLEREMAEMNRRSVATSWEGLMSTAEVLHSEWWGGKRLEDLGEELTKGRKVLLVAGDKDDATPRQWAEYLESKYSNARLKIIEGGHISAIFNMDEIWADFMNM